MAIPALGIPGLDALADALVTLALRRGLPPNLAPELRYAAYRDFRRAVLRATFALDLWTATRPTILGAVWSWPVALGSFRSYLRHTQEMLVQFAEVVSLGTTEVADSAATVTENLVALSREVKIPGRASLGQHIRPGPEYQVRRQELLNSVRAFMEVSTADLSKSRRARAASRG